MLRWIGLGLLVGCSFHDGVQPQPIDGPPPPDDSHEARTWSFDTGAEFATAVSTVDLTVDATRGSITPAGYIYGSLLFYGHDAKAVFTTSDPPEQITWDKVAPLAPSGIAVWPGVDIIDGQDMHFVGITNNDSFTTWMVGDVYLASGVHTFSMDADSVGLLEIAGAAGFERVITAINTTATGTFTAPAAGWYPIRIAWTDGTLGENLTIRHAAPSAALAPLRRDELRAHGSDVAGMLRWVFYRQMWGGGESGKYGSSPIPSIPQSPLLALVDWDAAPPQGSGGTPGNQTDWSLRYLGQLYITTPGTYTFHVHSDDGHQLRAGGMFEATAWGRDQGTIIDQTLAADLALGWNDLVLDYQQVGGMASLALDVMDGPDLVGAPIPAERLRPVEPRVDRVVTGAGGNGAAIQNNSATFTDVPVAFAGDPAEEVTSVDVTVNVDGDLGQMIFVLRAPDGNEVTLATHPNASGINVKRYFKATYPTPKTVGTWTVRVRDDTGGGNAGAKLNQAIVTLHTQKGHDQVAKAGVWISPVTDVETRLFAVDDVTWSERVPAGGQGAQVFLRACAMADCSDNPDWGSPLAMHATPGLPAERYLQAKIVLTTDGTHESELDAFSVTYRRDL